MTEDQWNLFEATYRAEQEKHSGTQPLNSRRRALEAVLAAQAPAQQTRASVLVERALRECRRFADPDGDPTALPAKALIARIDEALAAPPAPHAALREGRYEFPYNRTFQAIAAATSVYAEGVGINVSVKKFQDAFNSFPEAAALQPEAPAPVPNSEMLELANSIEGGHVRVHHLDARNEWASYKTDLVVKALRAASQVHCGQMAGDKNAEWWDALNGRLSRLDYTVELIGSALDAASVISAVTFASDDLSEDAKRALEKRKAAVSVAAYEFRSTFKHDVTALKLAVQAAPVRSPGATEPKP